MNRSIDSLIAEIATAYPFNSDRYPELKGMDEPHAMAFALKHQALHFAKTSGKMAAISEHGDHGGFFHSDQLREVATKSLINSLRLAEVLGLNEERLVELVRETIHEQ